MSKVTKFSLLLAVMLLLVFLGHQSRQQSHHYIELSQQIMHSGDIESIVSSKVDKLLEDLSVGFYDKYSKEQSEIQTKEDQASGAKAKSLKTMMLYFMTVILFALIFYFLDHEFLIIFIGTSGFITLFFGLTAPLVMSIMTKNISVIGTVTLSFDTKSIVSTIEKLMSDHNYFIGLLVVLFSIVLPLLKTSVILLYGFLKESAIWQKGIQWIDRLGKWSMADVFIVAFLVVFFSTKQEINSVLKIEVGFYFFLGYVLLSMLGSSLIKPKA